MVENYAGFDARDALRGINFEDACHVLGEVEHDGGVAALPGERSASAAGEQRSLVVAAEGHGGENVFFVARDDDADGDLAVVRAVGRVEGAATRVKAHFSAKMAPKSGFERGGIEVRGLGGGWGNVLRHRVQNILEDAGVARKG